MDLITPEIGLLFWQTIVFLVLILILAKFAWRPILGAVKEREDSINNALSSAEEARKEMQNLKADNEQLRKEARELKEKVLASATEEAQTKADMIVAQAKESIEMEKKAAMAEIKSQVANLSIEIAEKVIRKELSSKEKQHQMINEMLGDVTLN